MGIMNKMKTVALRDLGTWQYNNSAQTPFFYVNTSAAKAKPSSSFVSITGYTQKDLFWRQTGNDKCVGVGSDAIAVSNLQFNTVSAFLESEGDKTITYETIDSVEEKIMNKIAVVKLRGLPPSQWTKHTLTDDGTGRLYYTKLKAIYRQDFRLILECDGFIHRNPPGSRWETIPVNSIFVINEGYLVATVPTTVDSVEDFLSIYGDRLATIELADSVEEKIVNSISTVRLRDYNWGSNTGRMPSNTFYATTKIQDAKPFGFVHLSDSSMIDPNTYNHGIYIDDRPGIIMMTKKLYDTTAELKVDLEDVILTYQTNKD